MAVRDHLLSDGAVSALVSTRIYQLVVPQGLQQLAIRLQLIDAPKGYHLRGPVDLTRHAIQVDAYGPVKTSGDPYAAVVALADAIDAALSGQTFLAGSPSAYQIVGCFRESRRPVFEEPEVNLLRVLQEYTVWARSA